MDIEKIVLLLKNSGLKEIKVGNGFIEFNDPACIYSAFDQFLDIAWIVILILTAIMLFGWGVLYIKNGVKWDTLSKNIRTLVLIFCIFSIVKPIVNAVYGDNLFARGCDKMRVSLSAVQELLELRNKNLSKVEDELYEIFDMSDSGVMYDPALREADNQYMYEQLNKQRESLAQRIENQNLNNTATTNTNNTNNNTNNTTNNTQEHDFIRVTYTDDATIYINSLGEKIKRTGGSAAWRNNNPGNIRKSKSAYDFGAIGETAKWAVFPDAETGLNAITKLLRSKNYKNLSVKDAIHRWAPSSDGNNPESYARKVSKMTGLPANAKINSLNDSEIRQVAEAIKVIEGWNVGREEKL